MARRYVLIEGERRWRAAHLVGLAVLDCVVLDKRPSDSDLRILQLSIEAHRSGLSPIELSDFMVGIAAERNWSVTDLAKNLNMRQPRVSKLLKYKDGCPELRKLLHDGHIDMDRAYTLCQEPDHAKQRDLLALAGSLDRHQLRRKTHSNGEPVELKASRAKFALPGATQ